MASEASTPSKKPRVVSLGTPKFISQEYLSDFQQDFEFSVLEAYDREETLKRLPKDIQENGPISAFIVRMNQLPYEPFDEELLHPLAPDCRIVASAKAGFDAYDVKWMKEQGIWFCNTVNAVAHTTANMAIFLMLAVLRNATNAERSARRGGWRNGAPGIVPTRDPSGLTIGILGMGSIGKCIAEKATAFNLKILYHNRHQLLREDEEKCKATYCSTLQDLLFSSDIVSISVPLNKKTTGMIGPKEFATMKDGAFLINTARGAIVQEAALIDALESGKVTRAGLDVFCNEPNINPYFLSSDKVIIQPHVGGLTDVAFRESERECFENIKALYRTGKPNSPIHDTSDMS